MQREKGGGGIPIPASTVASLKPAPAITVYETLSVYQIAQYMAARRADAVLVVSEDGLLSGILTDKDITYRVVAQGLDVRNTTAASVMTRNPIAVQKWGPRNDALNIMIEKKFRHLPVIISEGEMQELESSSSAISPAAGAAKSKSGLALVQTNVVGLLDITKCVFDRLEDLEVKVTEDANIVAAMEALQRRGTVSSDHVGNMKSKHGCPAVECIISGEDHVVPELTTRATVRDAVRLMRDTHRTAVLITSATESDGKPSGILTTKDIALRVVAAGLDPATTSVVRVMTPHPDCIPKHTTILDALKKLRAGHYLHLPVMEGKVSSGLVDVMSLTMAMLEYLMGQEIKNRTSDDDHDSGPLWSKFWNSTFSKPGGVTDPNDVDPDDRHSAVSMGDTKSIDSHTFVRDSSTTCSSIVVAATAAAAAEVISNSPQRRGSSTLASRTQQQQQHSSVAASSVISVPLTTTMTTTATTPFRQPAPPPLALDQFSYKLVDPDAPEKVFRLTSSAHTLSELQRHIQARLRASVCFVQGGGGDTLWYTDDEGDLIQLTNDRELREAVEMACAAGWSKLMLKIENPRTAAAAAAAAAVKGGGIASGDQAQAVGKSSSAEAAKTSSTYTAAEMSYHLIHSLRDMPLPAQVAVSSGIAIVAAFLMSRLLSK